MGYESLEKDSLITLRTVLLNYVKKGGNPQSVKDANYELGRIEAQLSYR